MLSYKPFLEFFLRTFFGAQSKMTHCTDFQKTTFSSERKVSQLANLSMHKDYQREGLSRWFCFGWTWSRYIFSSLVKHSLHFCHAFKNKLDKPFTVGYFRWILWGNMKKDSVFIRDHVRYSIAIIMYWTKSTTRGYLEKEK